jgi:hypothetical protein
MKVQLHERPQGYENLAMLLMAAILFIIVLAAVNSESIVLAIKVAFSR